MKDNNKNLPLKPSWRYAPQWAKSLGICRIPDDTYENMWCFCAGENPVYFSNLELRPI